MCLTKFGFLSWRYVQIGFIDVDNVRKFSIPSCSLKEHAHCGRTTHNLQSSYWRKSTSLIASSYAYLKLTPNFSICTPWNNNNFSFLRSVVIENIKSNPLPATAIMSWATRTCVSCQNCRKTPSPNSHFLETHRMIIRNWLPFCSQTL